MSLEHMFMSYVESHSSVCHMVSESKTDNFGTPYIMLKSACGHVVGAYFSSWMPGRATILEIKETGLFTNHFRVRLFAELPEGKTICLDCFKKTNKFTQENKTPVDPVNFLVKKPSKQQVQVDRKEAVERFKGLCQRYMKPGHHLVVLLHSIPEDGTLGKKPEDCVGSWQAKARADSVVVLYQPPENSGLSEKVSIEIVKDRDAGRGNFQEVMPLSIDWDKASFVGEKKNG